MSEPATDPVDALRAQIAGTQPDDAPESADVETHDDTQPADPDAWYRGLDATTRTAVDAYTTKLKTALANERKQSKEREKQLRELLAKPDESTWKERIETLTGELTEANARASFMEAASEQADLPPKRYVTAYKIAKMDGLIGDDGAVDWDAMRKTHDYLFATVPTPNGNAGTGVRTTAKRSENMNDILRSARR